MPELVPALDRPTPTADRKIAAMRRGMAQRGGLAGMLKSSPDSYTIPAIDTLALSQQYGMAEASKPHWKVATFQAPLGCTDVQYEKIRFDAMHKFIKAMNKQGWDLLASENYRPKVTPGVYPAYDLETGLAILDRREMLIGMWFTYRNPKPVRIELPPHMLNPYTIQR
jgi:hypothetical protein